MPQSTAFLVRFGIGDMEPTPWDGSVSVEEGTIASIQGWRFGSSDSSDYRSSWKASTRYSPPNAIARREGRLYGPVIENGIVITASDIGPRTLIKVDTKQGSFSFSPRDIPYGEPKGALQNKVIVERVPSTLQLTTSDEEQDFPAVAQTDDEILLAYIDFTHGDRTQDTPLVLNQEPPSFDFLARPAGGDQVKLMRYSKASRTWSASVAVSDPGLDCMRVAVAVDGRKRVWVIWSANKGGNFDLYAKYLEHGQWSREIRITTDAGTDINPVAATDTTGRVWIAWQGYRNGSLDILAATQEGNAFTRETVISASAASDWDPSIARGANGEIAVAWDTYDKGDYDVYFRRLRFQKTIVADPPVPVATTENFEARPSIAYDGENRLWVAYEIADAKWGKAFGSYDTSGTPLYQAHNIKVKCFVGDQAMVTTDDPADLLRIPPNAPVRIGRRRRLSANAAAPKLPPMPDPTLAEKRIPARTVPQPPATRNSFPRLTADRNGLVYLAYRIDTGGRSGVGTIWQEHLLYFNGSEWNGPLSIPHTDGLLDNRPALVSPEPGEVLLISASDHRQAALASDRDFVNSDLYAADIRLEFKLSPAELRRAENGAVAISQETLDERAQVARNRERRTRVQGTELRTLRGDFHRHTEFSADGGLDGPLVDAYRYFIDAAALDWAGCCDFDNGGSREYWWWLQQKYTDAYKLGERFIPLFSYERAIRYPEGHRNILFAQRGIRPLPRLRKVADDAPFAPAPDTDMLYHYLARFGGIAVSHTPAGDMGTDWRNNDPALEPVVEIYQGYRQSYERPDSPKSIREDDAIAGWRPAGFVSNALLKGYRLGFTASSDHISTHLSYTHLLAASQTREGILEALKKRRVYAATDNIMADVRCEGHMMGDEFDVQEAPVFLAKFRGTAAFIRIEMVKDNEVVYTFEPNSKDVKFTWLDEAAQKGKTSYYYLRGEQADGQLVWLSPMWITYR